MASLDFDLRQKRHRPTKNKVSIGVALSPKLAASGKWFNLHVFPRQLSLKISPSDWLPGEPRLNETNLALKSAIARRTILNYFL